MNIHKRSDNTAFQYVTYSEWEWAMIRPGGRGQWFVLAMFQRVKMRQSVQYVSPCIWFYEDCSCIHHYYHYFTHCFYTLFFPGDSGGAMGLWLGIHSSLRDARSYRRDGGLGLLA